MVFKQMTNNSVDVTIEICGSSGDGSIASGQMLNLAMTGIGFHVMNFDSFPAEIRGFGPSTAHSRISSKPLFSIDHVVDCIISLNDSVSISKLASLKETGVVIYDSSPRDYLEEEQAIAGVLEPGITAYGVPLHELSTKAVRSAKSRNIAALGALAGIFNIPNQAFHQAIQKRFANKRSEIIESNIKAFELGYDYAIHHLDKVDSINFASNARQKGEKVEILSGNEMAAKACLDAGLDLYCGYPITPATRIMELLALHLPQYGGSVVQTEDEISAIGHIIGGGYAGKRCATATSGPGLCLMTEMLNLAVMAEVPAVIIDSQRAGPSTGLPTKTEQSDLAHAIYGGNGDSPKPVLAPADVKECYELVIKSFELAEAFQTPVIVLLDFFLSNRMEDIDWRSIAPGRFGEYKSIKPIADQLPYNRYQLTESGVSPMAVPGIENLFFTATGLEHNEQGFPDYTPDNHQRMTRKRRQKMHTLTQAWPPPQPIGDSTNLEVGLISWGTSIGAAHEAVEILRKNGIKAGGLFPRLLWPLPESALLDFSKRTKTLFVAELNETGQFANIISSVINRKTEKIVKIGGIPFSANELVKRIKDTLVNDQE